MNTWNEIYLLNLFFLSAQYSVVTVDTILYWVPYIVSSRTQDLAFHCRNWMANLYFDFTFIPFIFYIFPTRIGEVKHFYLC